MTRPCESDGCKRQSSFGFETNRPMFCKEHKKSGMVNVKNVRCGYGGCTTRPNFGTEWQKPRFCKKHKEPGMTNVTARRCEHAGCDDIAVYGAEGGRPLRCSAHKHADMVDIININKRCECAGCDKIPSFGTEYKKPRFCKKHREHGMTNVKSKQCEHGGCCTSASFGFPGHAPARCRAHIEAGMIRASKKRCTECKEPALYGIDVPLRCETHHDPAIHRNLVENPCTSCGLLYTLTDGMCESCHPDAQRTARLYKQRLVETSVRSMKIKGAELVSVDRMVNGGECLRERPDFLFDCGTHYLVLEVDEHQHASRACECEIARMQNLTQALGMRTVFVRYNPDQYRSNGIVDDPGHAQRMKVLGGWLRHMASASNVPTDMVTGAGYLYYDGYTQGDKVIVDFSPHV